MRLLNGSFNVLGGVRRSVASPPTPADPVATFVSEMFGAGQPGVLYLNSLEAQGEPALFSDTAGTTPLTGPGTVSRMRDLSGNGRFATVTSSSSNNPQYPGLIYDGSDGFHIEDTDMWRGSEGALVGATFNVDSTDSSSKLILGATVTPSTGSDLFILYCNGSQLRIGGRRLTSDSFQFVTVGTITAGVPYVAVAYINWLSGEATIRLNGEELTTPFQTPGLTDDQVRGTSIAQRYTGSTNFPGMIGSVFMRDASSVPSDLVKVSQFLANHDGIQL